MVEIIHLVENVAFLKYATKSFAVALELVWTNCSGALENVKRWFSTCSN